MATEKQLFEAATLGNTPAVKKALARGADVNARDKFDWTPLHRAALGGFPPTVTALLEAGADPRSQHIGHCTPLHYAARRGNRGCVEILTKWDPHTVFLKNENKRTPSDEARVTGHIDIVAWLADDRAAIPGPSDKTKSNATNDIGQVAMCNPGDEVRKNGKTDGVLSGPHNGVQDVHQVNPARVKGKTTATAIPSHPNLSGRGASRSTVLMRKRPHIQCKGDIKDDACSEPKSAIYVQGGTISVPAKKGPHSPLTRDIEGVASREPELTPNCTCRELKKKVEQPHPALRDTPKKMHSSNVKALPPTTDLLGSTFNGHGQLRDSLHSLNVQNPLMVPEEQAPSQKQGSSVFGDTLVYVPDIELPEPVLKQRDSPSTIGDHATQPAALSPGNDQSTERDQGAKSEADTGTPEEWCMSTDKEEAAKYTDRPAGNEGTKPGDHPGSSDSVGQNIPSGLDKVPQLENQPDAIENTEINLEERTGPHDDTGGDNPWCDARWPIRETPSDIQPCVTTKPEPIVSDTPYPPNAPSIQVNPAVRIPDDGSHIAPPEYDDNAMPSDNSQDVPGNNIGSHDQRSDSKPPASAETCPASDESIDVPNTPISSEGGPPYETPNGGPNEELFPQESEIDPVWDVLIQNRAHLVDTIILDASLWDVLIRDGIVTIRERDSIQLGAAMDDQISRLLDHLRHRSASDYATFRKALIETNQHDVVSKCLPEADGTEVTREPFLEILIKNRVVLVNDIDLDAALWNVLVQDKIVTKRQRDEIQLENTSHDQVSELLDFLGRRGSCDYETFRHALIETNQSHIVESYLPSFEGNLTVRPIDETDDTVRPTDETDDTVRPIDETDDTVRPTDEIDDTVRPTDETDDTVRPTDETDDTVRPTDETDDTVRPTDETDDTVRPTDEINDTVRPTDEIADTGRPVDRMEDPCLPTDEINGNTSEYTYETNSSVFTFCWLDGALIIYSIFVLITYCISWLLAA